MSSSILVAVLTHREARLGMGKAGREWALRHLEATAGRERFRRELVAAARRRAGDGTAASAPSRVPESGAACDPRSAARSGC